KREHWSYRFIIMTLYLTNWKAPGTIFPATALFSRASLMPQAKKSFRTDTPLSSHLSQTWPNGDFTVTFPFIRPTGKLIRLRVVFISNLVKLIMGWLLIAAVRISTT